MSTDDYWTLISLQIAPSSEISETLHKIETILLSVAQKMTSISCVVLPEYIFGTALEWKEKEKPFVEHTSKKILDVLCSLSKQYSMPLISGTMPYTTSEGMWRNRCYVISENGEIMGFYDKMKPFRTEKRLGLEPGESTQTLSFNLNSCRIAIIICSDLWFPEIARNVAPNADIIAIPIMTTVLEATQTYYARWTWHSLISTRSKENVIPIVCADHPEREYYNGVFTSGASCIADPTHRFENDEGPFLQTLKTTQCDSETVLVSNIRKDSVASYREYRRDVGLLE